MNPSFTRKFLPSVRLAMWGPGSSAANYSAISGNYLAGVAAAEDFFHGPINLLRVGFKNSEFVNFGALRPPDEHTVVGQRGSIRVQRVADVAFVPIDPKNPQPVAMAMLNADCPGIFAIEHDEGGQAIGCWFAHAGLDCLLPKESNKYSVLETIWHERQVLGMRGNIDFYFGGGIGPCCYGFENSLEVQTRIVQRYHPAATVQRFLRQSVAGPRRDQTSIILSEIFKAEVVEVFSRCASVSISFDDRCTACMGISGGHGNRLLWSNVYDGGKDKVPLNPRNLTCFCWTPPRHR